jgi:RNA polymerase sigma factor (sigma-70 family)
MAGSPRLNRRDIHILFSDGAIGRLADGPLLERFASGGDDAQLAFETIVSRHGAMVFGVCRRVLGDEHSAEDAFQATFLVLALRAGGIRQRDSLGPWLHGVASRIARRAHDAAHRRGRHEEAAARTDVEPKPAASAAEAAEIRSVIDEELDRLPEKYRRPVVLCYLEGRSQEEAARELSWTKGTVSGRLARAKDLLRGRLTRRGLAPTAGTLAAVLGSASRASAAVPTTLSASTVRAALAVSLGHAEAVGISNTALALAKGGLRTMMMGKIRAAAAATLLATLAGAFALAFAGPAHQSDPGHRDGKEAVAAPPDDARAVDPLEAPLPERAKTRMGTTRLRHEDHVTAVAFAPDGRTLASAGWDGVRLWDRHTGAAAPGPGPAIETGGALALAYSPDGALLAIGRQGGEVEVRDVAAGQTRLRLKAHKGRVMGLAFSPDGRTLASSSNEETCVRLWDIAAGREFRILAFDEPLVYLGPLAYSPDGKRLALGMSTRVDDSETIRIWDLAAGDAAEPVVIRDAHDRNLASLVFTRDGRTLLSGGCRDEEVRDEAGNVRSLRTRPQLRLWDPETGRRVGELAPPEVEGPCALALMPDGRTLVSAHRDRLLVWDLDVGRVARTIRAEPNDSAWPGGLAVSPDGRTIAAQRGDHKVHLWDFATGEESLPQPDAHDDAVLDAVATPDGRLLATAGADGTTRLWDQATGEHLRRLQPAGTGWVRSLAISPDGRTLAEASETPGTGAGFGGLLRLRDLPGGRLRWEQPLATRACVVAFSPDGRLVAVASHNAEADLGLNPDHGPPDDAIRAFDAESGELLATLDGHDGEVRAIAFTPDGRGLVSASEDGTFRVWDLSARNEIRQSPIRGHFRGDEHRPGEPTRIISASISSDARTAVTSGLWDDRLIVWDLETGEPLRAIPIEGGRGFHVAVSPDGQLLAAARGTRGGPADLDTAIRLFDPSSGRELLRLETGGREVRSLAFSPDGRTLLTGMNDTTAMTWDTAPALQGLGR